jgi:uncharacterized protein YkwD
MLRSTTVAGLAAALILGTPVAAANAAGPRAGAECRDLARIAADAAPRTAARALTCLVNRARAEKGLRRLRRSTPLVSAATTHSIDMVAAGYFSHVGSDGSAVRQRATAAGYMRRNQASVVGETLSWGAGTAAAPSELFAALMRSEPHRRTLLDARFRDIGVGLVTGAPGASIDLPAATVTLVLGRR